ncbi:MAG: hypothetical protein ACPLZY_04405, partial [Candidatus Norongarragalinales archaeon]
MARKTTTVYLEEDNWRKLIILAKEKLGKTASQRLDELIAEEVARLEGRETPLAEQADYQHLKTLHTRLV